jgi:hypothetical protein
MGALNAYIVALHDKDDVEATIQELGKLFYDPKMNYF